MNRNGTSSLRKSIALGALLLLAAAASGCGVGLPTQPDIDSGAVSGRDAGVGQVQETNPALEIDGSIIPGGGSEGEPPAPTDEVNLDTPGNSEWGHSHKKPGQ